MEAANWSKVLSPFRVECYKKYLHGGNRENGVYLMNQADHCFSYCFALNDTIAQSIDSFEIKEHYRKAPKKQFVDDVKRVYWLNRKANHGIEKLQKV